MRWEEEEEVSRVFGSIDFFASAENFILESRITVSQAHEAITD